MRISRLGTLNDQSAATQHEREQRMSDVLVETFGHEAVHSKKDSKIPTRIPTCKDRKNAKASASESDSVQPPSSHSSTAKVRTRHASGKEKKPGIPSSSSKENIPPAQHKKPNFKCNVSYMELKRRHEELVSEVQTLSQQSKKTEDQHQAKVNSLAGEIRHYKESNAALKQDISTYQAMIEAKNQDLDALQQHLEDIKFENERLASILEGCRLDALTGEKIEKAIDFQSREHETQFDLEEHEQNLDTFIATLETTITALKHQKEKIEQTA